MMQNEKKTSMSIYHADSDLNKTPSLANRNTSIDVDGLAKSFAMMIFD